MCPLWLQHALLNDWIERRWAAPLTLTPCDLWRFLGPANGFPGRTLWVIGDSQVGGLMIPRNWNHEGGVHMLMRPQLLEFMASGSAQAATSLLCVPAAHCRAAC